MAGNPAHQRCARNLATPSRTLALALLLGSSGCTAPRPASPPDELRFVVVQVPAGAPVQDWALTPDPVFPTGTRIVLASSAGGQPSVLSAGLDAAAWPAVSPDGTRLLFAGRRAPGEPWSPWLAELPPARAPSPPAPRPLPGGPGSCTAPRWLARDAVVMRCADPSAPSLAAAPRGVEALSEQAAAIARAAAGRGFDPALGSAEGALWVWEPDLASPRRITFAFSPQEAPEVLADGRIVHGQRTFVHVPLRETYEEWTALQTVHPDGSTAERLQDHHFEPQLKMNLRLLERHALLFVGAGSGGTGTGRGALFELSLHRPARPAVPLRHDLRGSVVAGAPGWAAGELLLCWQADGARLFGVHLTGRRTGQPTDLLLADAGHHVADVAAVAPRSPPAMLPALVQEGKASWLYLLDAHLTDPEAGFTIHRGAVGQAQLVTAKPLPPPPPLPDPQDFLTTIREPPSRPLADVGGALPGFDRLLLGTLAVWPDGSFLVQVPADVPLSLRLLSSSGDLVRDAGGWFWVRPGEKRGCIGCHESPQRIPPNRPCTAFSRPPSRLEPADRGRPLALPAPQKGEPGE